MVFELRLSGFRILVPKDRNVPLMALIIQSGPGIDCHSLFCFLPPPFVLFTCSLFTSGVSVQRSLSADASRLSHLGSYCIGMYLFLWTPSLALYDSFVVGALLWVQLVSECWSQILVNLHHVDHLRKYVRSSDNCFTCTLLENLIYF